MPEVTPKEAANLLAYLKEHTRMKELSNEELCREVLATAPVFGRLGELVDILCDRLCPGIVERLEEEPTACEPPSAALDREINESCEDCGVRVGEHHKYGCSLLRVGPFEGHK